MNMEKIISIVIMSLSILIIFSQPFGKGVIIDDHYRQVPWQEMIYLFTFLFGLSMYPSEYVQTSNKTGEKNE